jgi:hypothetical protein
LSAERVVVAERFAGPPGAANGGWVCGLLAARLPAGPVEVTLRRPVPLGTPLAVEVVGGAAVLRTGEEVLAEGRPAAAPETGAVPHVGLAASRAATLRPEQVEAHPFPGCFGCGPERDPAEAVALHPGPVPGHPGVWTTAWTPGAGLPQGPGGALDPALAWVALDCPSAAAAVPVGAPPHVLGRLCGEVAGELRVGEELAVVAWGLGHEGRKRWAASAIVRPEGTVVARARATWIALAG